MSNEIEQELKQLRKEARKLQKEIELLELKKHIVHLNERKGNLQEWLQDPEEQPKTLGEQYCCDVDVPAAQMSNTLFGRY